MLSVYLAAQAPVAEQTTVPQTQAPIDKITINQEPNLSFPLDGLVLGATALGIGIVGWFARSYFDNRDQRDKVADQRLQRLEENHSELEKQLLQHRLDAQERYVTREDFMVVVGKIDSRVERIGGNIQQLALSMESLKERIPRA